MDSPFDQAQVFTNLWTDFATRLASAGLAMKPGDPPTDAARDIRSATFKALGEAADQFMRSPPFLEMMKHSLDATLTVRKQMNQLMTRAHHDAQSVARQDIDAVLQSLRHIEHRLLDGLEDVNRRLAEMSRRLDALEASNRSPSPIETGGSHA